jgi:hypothetical protein
MLNIMQCVVGEYDLTHICSPAVAAYTVWRLPRMRYSQTPLTSVELEHNSTRYRKGTETMNEFYFSIEYVIVDDSAMIKRMR